MIYYRMMIGKPGVNDLDAVFNREDKKNYPIYIPKSYSRMETNIKPDFKDLDKIECYKLYITRQIGTARNRRDTNIYFELPKSKRLVRIILFMDGGVNFDKLDHKYILRETDALDRRIILGYCIEYQWALLHACYEDPRSNYLQDNAWRYRCNEMPKRLKLGSLGNDLTKTYRKLGGLKPYEESKIFSGVRFLNETA